MQSIAICPGDSAFLSRAFQSMAGLYYDTWVVANNCDSLIETTLIVGNTYNTVTPEVIICTGDSALIFGIYRDTSGTYIDSSSTLYGCDSITTTTLLVNQIFSVSIVDPGILCQDLCDVSLISFVSGGVAPYTYLWDDPSNQTSQTATGLCFGSYSLTVADSNNCVVTLSVTVSGVPPFTLMLGTIPDSLNNGNGLAWVSVTGSSDPYSYQWSDPATQTTDTATGLSMGFYAVTVSDAFGCIDSSTVTVDNGVALSEGSGSSIEVLIHPNPNSGEFMVQLRIERPTNIQIVIFDNLGKELLRTVSIKITSQFEIPLDLREYSTGVYRVQLITEQGIVNKQLVIE